MKQHTHFGVWPRSEAIVAGKRDVSWQMCWFVLLQVRAVQPLWKYGWTDPSLQLGWPRKQTWITSRPSMSARVLVWVVISCCTPWNFSRYYLEAGGRLYNSVWSSQLAAINHAAALALSWDLFCLSSSAELETKLWDPTLTGFPICLFNKCYLESSPFWEFVVVVNRMSECSVSWGWEGAWKGTKAHGIGTEMGISPGNSRNCNRLTENGYWLLASTLLCPPERCQDCFLSAVRLLPREECFIQWALEHCCCENCPFSLRAPNTCLPDAKPKHRAASSPGMHQPAFLLRESFVPV